MLNCWVYHVYLAMGATDLRKSIDGLAILVQGSFNLDTKILIYSTTKIIYISTLLAMN
jgi:hypothetical protein